MQIEIGMSFYTCRELLLFLNAIARYPHLSSLHNGIYVPNFMLNASIKMLRIQEVSFVWMCDLLTGGLCLCVILKNLFSSPQFLVSPPGGAFELLSTAWDEVTLDADFP